MYRGWWGFGYVGILKLYKNSCVFKKKSKGGKLSAEEKAEHRRLARVRILIEHIMLRLRCLRLLLTGM